MSGVTSFWPRIAAALVVPLLAVGILPVTAGAQQTTTTTSSTTTTTTTSTTTTSSPTTTTTTRPGSVVAQAVPVPGATQSVITVKVGGDRSGASAVLPQQGVTLQLFDNDTTQTPTAFTSPNTCVSDVDGDCSWTVNNTGTGGSNRDRRFWVRQIAPAAPNTFSNPSLNVGTGPWTPATYQFQTCSQLRGGQTCSSTATGVNGFMISTGATNTASGGIWQTSRTNPTLTAVCGLRVALVLDLSGSVAPNIADLRTAAKTFVNSLVGTPSAVGLFTFASNGPANTTNNQNRPLTSVSTATGANSAATVNGWIDGVTAQTTAQFTNWDRALNQVTESAQAYDVAVVITDGNPTAYGIPATTQTDGRTRFREVENGIFSANGLKAKGTRVIGFGVGAGVTSSGLNLQSISGQTLSSDYYQTTNYAEAGAALTALAQGACHGSVSVIKQVIPPGGTTADAVPASGWVFGATTPTTGVTINPGIGVTDTTGGISFALTFPGGVTTAPVTVAETQQPGFTLVPQGDLNASCRNIATNTSVPVTNSGALGFQVDALADAPISCTVFNQAPNPPATIQVNKVWNVNGVSFPDGQQPGGLSAELSINGAVHTFGVAVGGFNVGMSVVVDETVTNQLPLCTVTGQALTLANGTTVNQPVPAAVRLDVAANTYTLTNVVSCTSSLQLTKTVVGGTALPTAWNLQAIAPNGALAGPNGATGTPGATANVSPGVVYALAESGGDPNYVQDLAPGAVLVPDSTGSWSCVMVDGAGNVIPGFSDGLNGGVTVPLGQRVRCGATNRTVDLVLRKDVIHSFGGTAVPSDWNLTVTPTGTPPPGLLPQTVAGSSLGATVHIRPGQNYSLSESGGPSGYQLQSIVCNGTQSTSVTLQVGQTVICTFTNRDVQPTLTLVKTVTNDNGGTAVPTAWTLTATGPSTISGATGTPSVTSAPVNAGTYTLSETGPAGYTPGSWSCNAGTLTGSSLELPVGVNATCTINNDDQAAALTLVKTVTNNNGGTALPTAWTLTATGAAATISGVTGSTAVTNAAVPAGSYTLTESGPAGYASGGWSCDAGILTGSVLVLPNGVSATCTINNDDQPARLTLVKTVTNNDGGTAVPAAWTLTATGPNTISGATGSDAVTNALVNAGTYTLSEAGPSGYTAGAWSCTAGTLTGSSLVLPVGVSATCTINNDDQPASLTLVKTVTNDNGGTAVPAAWTLTATGPITISGATGSASVTNAAVPAGPYALSETGPAGYAAGAWSCDAGVLTGTLLVLPSGVSATCTINNDDNASRLTLVKTVTNDNGGTAAATDWTLSATGPTTISGATGTSAVSNALVDAGTYNLSETGPSGYAASAWSCTAGTLTGSSLVLPNGVNATCTIHNDDQAATLTLVKTVTNDNGGAAVPTDWTLTATGPTTITGATGSTAVTNAPVSAGTYALTESGPAGYTAGAWSCTAGTLTDSSLVLPTGVSATCTINNNDQPASLTLVKTVTNDDGGAAVATDWTLTATGPTPISGATGTAAVTSAPVSAGTYALSESGPAGYTASAWSCTAGTLTGSSLVLPNGVSATCTINNDDVPAKLTLVKTVTNDDGGTAVATDWTLTATGPTSISGATGSAAVTGASVSAGTYALSESGPDGYTPGPWSCDAGTLTGSSLVLPNGVSATCTIVNDDQPATLTLVKTVTNDSGGTAQPTDWTLTATGPTSISGVTGTAEVTSVPVDAGSYTLSESGPDGYVGTWSCRIGESIVSGSQLQLASGESATCTIDNDDQSAALTLVKSVTNDNGGTAAPADWTLAANGPTPITGASGDPTVTNRPVDAGTYVLSESGGPDGYTAGDWSCDAGTLTGSSLVLPVGVHATCTIVNDDQPATLTLEKVVDPGAGGTTRVPADWTLTATPLSIPGQGVVSGLGDPTSPDGVNGVSVFAGVYTLSEAGPTGFEQSSWTCTGGAVDAGQVTVPNGGDVSCTITNTAIQPRLTLKKVVDVGTDPATAWTLTAASTDTTITGATGDPAVTNALVTIGSYTLSESGPAGYTASAWFCDGATVDGSTVSVVEGTNATCTITNTAIGTWMVAKTANPAAGTVVQPGSTITYTVSATKTGGVDPTGLTVTDDLAGVLAHATFNSGSIDASIGDASFVDGKIVWTIDDLPDPVGPASATLTYSVTVSADAFGATLKNSVTATSDVSPPSDCLPGEAAPAAECSVSHTTASAPTTTTTTIPGPGVESATTIPTTQPESGLAFTGTRAGDLISLGVILLGLGLGSLVIRRRGRGLH